MTISVSSSFPIQHSMLDVRCSSFFSKPSTVPRRKNNLSLFHYFYPVKLSLHFAGAMIEAKTRDSKNTLYFHPVAEIPPLLRVPSKHWRSRIKGSQSLQGRTASPLTPWIWLNLDFCIIKVILYSVMHYYTTHICVMSICLIKKHNH